MKQIITHFTDNDLYTFTVQYYILRTYPRAQVRYQFMDRKNTKYPKGFGKLLQEQVDYMRNVAITEEEIEFMRRKVYFLPEWYYNFLRGVRFNPSEVHIFQDGDGYLSIVIEGNWWSAILWDVTLLSIISELMHMANGDTAKVSMNDVYNRGYAKGKTAIANGLLLSDMGTRRRFSFDVQRETLRGLVDAQNRVNTENHGVMVYDKDNGDWVKASYADGNWEGRFVGTSNVWFAKEFDITPIGTMSHQVCSVEECVSGVFECNYQVMKKWAEVYDGDLGIYLPDCFGSKVFLSNLSKKMAKLYDGQRVDSGDEREETEKIIDKYMSLGIDPRTKSVVYSNALTITKAVELHNWLGGRMKDSYGIGTHLMADVMNQETGEEFDYLSIVIKAIGFRITESRTWLDTIKLSNDEGKMIGNKEKCEYIAKMIRMHE